MASAGWARQRAIYETLTGSSAVATVLGGARVHDDVPRGAELPYLTIGQSSARDWSTGTEDGEEHTLTVHVWSRANGRKQVQEIMGVVRGVLNDAALSLSGHRLVNLRHEFGEARRDPDGETYHGLMRFRAVTEPI